MDSNEPRDSAPVAAAFDSSVLRQRIMIVEDDRDSAEMLCLVLRLSGHQTKVAHDGATALQELARWQPDVILCDLGLTDTMSGLEFARACRQEPRLAHVRLIAVSGYCASADADRARAAGFERLLSKPLDVDTICSALERPAISIA
jgi:CheY-like chemotaxis protein